MNKNRKIILASFLIIFLTACGQVNNKSELEKDNIDRYNLEELAEQSGRVIYLPEPQTDGAISVEETLQNRRSQRQFLDEEISLENLSQILWAAYGITQPRENPPFLRGGLRTAPSAGALFPLEIYVAIGKVMGIEPGVYKYISKEHKIVRIIDRDLRPELTSAAWGQKMIEEAPASVIYTAIFSRMTDKYGERGRERYVCMDLGHSAQNIYLQAEALGLGTCAIGAFADEDIAKILNLPKEEEPLYIMPIGYYDR
jgi:SagB-type dehydrogenase family enzyme